MFSNQTPNYGLPQWQNDDTPTWLDDMNGAFANIDANLKRVEDKADEGGVPQKIIDRIVALETSVTNILTTIGADAISGIGTSITNAIVNLKTLIDTATTNITNLTTKIGNTDISEVGNSITQAIRNLADAGGTTHILPETTSYKTGDKYEINGINYDIYKIILTVRLTPIEFGETDTEYYVEKIFNEDEITSYFGSISIIIALNTLSINVNGIMKNGVYTEFYSNNGLYMILRKGVFLEKQAADALIEIQFLR